MFFISGTVFDDDNKEVQSSSKSENQSQLNNISGAITKSVSKNENAADGKSKLSISWLSTSKLVSIYILLNLCFVCKHFHLHPTLIWFNNSPVHLTNLRLFMTSKCFWFYI